jgi:hypothetical protein
VSFDVVVSDALHHRVPRFGKARLAAFQRAVADVVKGRATGRHVHTSSLNKREFYALEQGGYTLYYSVDPLEPMSLVFEEHLSEEESDLILDPFASRGD